MFSLTEEILIGALAWIWRFSIFPESPYLEEQLFSKTLDQYGIGTHIPSILRGVPSLTTDDLIQLFKLQDKVGPNKILWWKDAFAEEATWSEFFILLC